MLQLSPFVLPQVRMGALRMTTVNMTEHPAWVAYTAHLADHLDYLVRLAGRGAVERDGVDRFHDRAFLGKILASIEWDAPDGPRVIRWPHAADFVSFDEDRLGVMFLDGRLRDERDMVYVPTGGSTPGFAAVVGAMARGTTAAELVALADRHGIDLDAEFVQMLVERGVVEELADPHARVAARFAPAPGDRVTWLGHTAMLFQSGPTTVWLDPLVPPRIRYREDEVAAAFSERLASALYMPPPYGPSGAQAAVGDLPPPDAIVLSREDVIAFDLGLLMCLPPETPIVVPAAQPGRPWQVDMPEVIARVLGDRRVIRLGHGETIAFGDVRITATAYAGEWPEALPTDWNTYIVRGTTGAVVATGKSAVVADTAERIAELLGDAGARAILFAFGLHPGEQAMQMGYRELPDAYQISNRPWPWFLVPEQLLEPNPVQGIGSDVLGALGDRTGLRRYFPYGAGGAPWLTFEPPHVHRYYIHNITREQHERQVATARSIGFEVPPLQIGVPFAL